MKWSFYQTKLWQGAFADMTRVQSPSWMAVMSMMAGTIFLLQVWMTSATFTHWNTRLHPQRKTRKVHVQVHSVKWFDFQIKLFLICLFLIFKSINIYTGTLFLKFCCKFPFSSWDFFYITGIYYNHDSLFLILFFG